MTRAIILLTAFALSGCSPQSLIGAAVIYSQVKAYANPHCPDGPFAGGSFEGMCDTTRMSQQQRREFNKREAATMKGITR